MLAIRCDDGTVQLQSLHTGEVGPPSSSATVWTFPALVRRQSNQWRPVVTGPTSGDDTIRPLEDHDQVLRAGQKPHAQNSGRHAPRAKHAARAVGTVMIATG